MGDKKNAIKKLQMTCRNIRLSPCLDLKEINLGSPKEYLRLYHHVFLDYNPALAAEILNKHGMELSSKNDKLFIDGIYKLVRDMFGYVPKLTKDQFFQTSFAQIKALMASDIIELILERFKLTPTVSKHKIIENNENLESKELSCNPRQPSIPRKPSVRSKNVSKPKEAVLKEQQLNVDESRGQNTYENLLNTLMEKINNLTFTFGNIVQRIDNIEEKIEEIKNQDKRQTYTGVESGKNYENLSNRITIIESDLINVKQMVSRSMESNYTNETTTYETPSHSFVNMSPRQDEMMYPKKSSLIQGLPYEFDRVLTNDNLNDLTINSTDSTPTLSEPVKQSRLSEEDKNIQRAQELVNRANRLSQMLSNAI
ncbi:centrosomal of 44 kDa-like isoform X1 [Brachionus plicatilis]|uniref:Centrosomal protein of 44 kDa n=1 Tax=Brachionus plicatilis TaxID=10195 RepID=A0A3M7QFF6_BRAPC|nr:centrosomal of 44 kDa-like isoform X1 [Brachionus plicatilis]